MNSTSLYCYVILWMSVGAIPLLTSRKPLPVSVDAENIIINKRTQNITKSTNPFGQSVSHIVSKSHDPSTTFNPTISMGNSPKKTYKIAKKIIEDTSIIQSFKSTTSVSMSKSNSITKRVPTSKFVDNMRDFAERRRLDSTQTSTDIAKMIKDIPHMSSSEIHTLYNKLRESGKLDLKNLSSLKEIVFKLDSLCCPI